MSAPEAGMDYTEGACALAPGLSHLPSLQRLCSASHHTRPPWAGVVVVGGRISFPFTWQPTCHMVGVVDWGQAEREKAEGGKVLQCSCSGIVNPVYSFIKEAPT